MVKEYKTLDNIKDILLGYADVCIYMQKATNEPYRNVFVDYVKKEYGFIPQITNDDNICGNMCQYSSSIESTTQLNDPENFKFVLQKVRNIEIDRWKVLVNKDLEETREVRMNRILRKADKKREAYKTINTSKIEIPQEYILLMRWFKWIDFDAINTNSLETSNQYEATRDWLTTEMHNWFGLDYYPVEEIITSNQIGFWIEFDRSFDKQ